MEFSISRIGKGIMSDMEKTGIELNQYSLTEWLKSKHIIEGRETLIWFNEIQPWQRSGGETYSTIFNFKTNINEKTIVVKAIVTTDPIQSLVDWTQRRAILEKNNVSVSHWYWTEDATIYEQYYPYKSDKTRDFNLLLQIAYKLDKLGFTTLKFLDDILCDKNGTPVYVDFGFDLGEPGPTEKTTAMEHLIKAYPKLRSNIERFYSKMSKKK